MADEDKDSKTEDPTGKRLEKARSEGDVPNSQEIKSLVVLISALVIIGFMAPQMMGALKALLSGFLSQVHTMPTDTQGLRTTLVGLVAEVAWLMILPIGVLILAALIANIGQVGMLYTPKKLEPKFSAVNPFANISKVISKQKLVDALKDTLKVVILLIAVTFFVLPMIPHPDTLIGKPMASTLEDLHWILVVLLTVVILTFGVVAVADLLWVRYEHRTKLKMTKQEVKDEGKQAEGDPIVKSRIRSLRMQRHRERMMAAVPRASVVITNPTHFAVALQYDMDSMAAPKLVAKGVDFLAARIREVAKEHDVPIVENPPLARALYASVELDEEIPQEHYKAVAEVIGYVMRLNGASRTNKKP